ncbi:MAG: universal stress protein [Planctomycetaceae bacterium]|nr:universal stress protein [Planctomycetaceae bacterium]
MTGIRRIVVGVEMPDTHPWNAANLSAPCRLAVRQAFHVAEAFSIPIELVCVLPEIAPGFFQDEKDAERVAASESTEAAEVLADLSNQYQEKAKTRITVHSRVRHGRPWIEILKAAGKDRQTLILCGTRDQNVVSRFLFGSTGQKLLRNAPGPVWLVKPRIDDDKVLDVLAATDLGEVGKDVLHTAVALGQALNVHLNVMHVVDEDLDRQMARVGASEEELTRYRRETLDAAEAKLHEQLSQTDYRTVPSGVQTHITEGSAHGCLLSAIKELDIDLLVMATLGRGGLPGMLLGNTAERLLPEVPCAVLVIKPDDFQCPIELD